MSAYRRQAHLNAPVEVVWDLVGNPDRHPEWWPRVIEVRGENFTAGDHYTQVTKVLTGRVETTFVVERRDDFREIQMSCQDTGAYAAWLLTEAQGGTFVELEMGMQNPPDVPNKIFDAIAGRP